MPTKGQLSAADYLKQLVAKGPEGLAAEYAKADAATIANANPRGEDQQPVLGDDNNAIMAQQAAVAHRMSLANSEAGRAQLAKEDYEGALDFAKKNVTWWDQNPDGSKFDGFLGQFIEQALPIVVIGGMLGGAAGLFGDAAVAVGEGGSAAAGVGGEIATGATGELGAVGTAGADVGAGSLASGVTANLPALGEVAVGDVGAGGLGAGAAGVGAGATGAGAGAAIPVVTIGAPTAAAGGGLTGADLAAGGAALGAGGADLGVSLTGGSGVTPVIDPVTNIVQGTPNPGANAAGEGYTYDMHGNVIPNADAAATQAAQEAASTQANLANGLQADGTLTPAQYASAQQLASQGMSITDIAKKFLGAGSTADSLLKLAGVITNALGTKYAADQAGKSADALSAASKEAAGVLAPAITQASTLQANAATKAGQDLATAATTSAGVRAGAATAGGNTLANAATSGAALNANAATGAAQTLSTAATQSAALQAGAAGYGADLVSNNAIRNGANLSNTALAGGQRLSAADLAAAATLATGYKDSAADKVAGYNAGIGTADSTLTTQTANQKPYMDAGTGALKQLQDGLAAGGQFNRPFTMADAQNMDAYKFALQQGQTAINNASAAGGLQLSSANIESLGKFAEGTAAQYQQQAFNQWMAQNNLTIAGLQNLVNTGQVSVSQLQSALAQHGVNVETLQSNIGQANADGTLGAANATATGTLNSAAHLTQGEKDAAAFLAAGNTTSANALSSGINAAAGFTAGGMKDSANSLAAGQVASAGYTAAGGNAAAGALANAGNQAAGFTGTGIDSAANATAAGDVSAAGYTAGGITGAANATAGGITGAANANAAGSIAQANIINSGVASIGNVIAHNTASGNLNSQNGTYTTSTHS